MGFFKDFKRDFAQAVNELMPDKDEMANEYDDEDMVNTFDENDDMEIAPEDILEDIDDYGDDDGESYSNVDNGYEAKEAPEREEKSFDEDDEDSYQYAELEKNSTSNIPSAELISEHDFNNLDEINPEDEEIINPEADELKSLDELDEENMMENMEDAEKLEEPAGESEYYGNPFDMMSEENNSIQDIDLLKDIEDAISKEEITDVGQEEEADLEETYSEEEQEVVANNFPEADKFREDVMAEVELNSQVNENTKALDDMFEVDTTYITKNTTINGDVIADGNIDVLGVVNGNVSCAGKLIIGGTIYGSIKAGDVYANATKVEGKIEADGNVKIGVGSIVVGDITATSALIAGAIHGDIDVHGPVIVDSTAVIMGNIKSRSVQINNGAVIEGFCSQCYSEIDVKSFFDVDDIKETEEKNEDTKDEDKEENKDE